MIETVFPLVVTSLFIFVLIFKSIVVISERQRGALFRLGRFQRIIGPGLFCIVPYIDTVSRIHLDDKIPGWQSYSPDQLNKKVMEIILCS